jgi:hypothetical protein
VYEQSCCRQFLPFPYTPCLSCLLSSLIKVSKLNIHSLFVRIPLVSPKITSCFALPVFYFFSMDKDQLVKYVHQKIDFCRSGNAGFCHAEEILGSVVRHQIHQNLNPYSFNFLSHSSFYVSLYTKFYLKMKDTNLMKTRRKRCTINAACTFARNREEMEITLVQSLSIMNLAETLGMSSNENDKYTD